MDDHGSRWSGNRKGRDLAIDLLILNPMTCMRFGGVALPNRNHSQPVVITEDRRGDKDFAVFNFLKTNKKR